MKIKDINAEITFELWVRPILADEFIETGIGYIDPDMTSNNTYVLRTPKKITKFVLRESSKSYDLNHHLKRGCARLAEIIQIAKDGSALMNVVFFNGDIVEIGNIEIGIDERIETTARRNGIRFNGTGELGEILNEKCKIRVGNEDFFLFMIGPAANTDFEAEEQEDDDSKFPGSDIQEQYRAFSICGDRVRIPVEKHSIDKFSDIFFATKIVFKDNTKSEGALRLARGSITFSDYTKTGQIRSLAAGAMRQLTKETGSYLKRWDEYGDIEGELLLAKARAVGRIDYHATEQTIKGVKFFVPSVPPQLSEGDELEVTSKVPVYLENRDMTWKEYSKILEKEFLAKKEKNKNTSDNKSVSAPIIKLANTSIELALPSVPSGQMFLILSINGDKIQIERRMRARQAILEGRSANPLLGLIIEENGELPEIQRVSKLKPLTPFVREKIFKHSPTDRQVEAIKVALNTPDIALIQGPPGTGKTTVITAILERLNEEYDKTKSIRGQILVSGFQHDAVENIVSRLSVNALPAVKFGRRAGESEFSENAVSEKIDRWCFDIAEKIRKKNPQIVQTEEQRELFELFRLYSLSPSPNNTANLMKRILDLPRTVISEEVASEAENILVSLQSQLKLPDRDILRLIRSLRITKVAFEDDGSKMACDVLIRLEEQLSESDKKILEMAARWKKGKHLDFLPDLKKLKGKLLYAYTPAPDFRIEKTREDVLKLVAEVSQMLEKSMRFRSKRDAVLAEFLHELEDNPNGVREAIEDYNFVFAATTQQSMGKAIIRSKNKYVRSGEKPEMVKYDTVIIDEAARTSPRDLLIPMSQAEKRIILVGDHRQLPHLIDEEVARALEEDDSDASNVNVDFVKKSMFEYLFRRLKKLEKKDGIKRTITLDAQYRMHPLLGDFVSKNFYEKYGEGFRSPLPEKNFEQKLRGIDGMAAVWIDVPHSDGKEEKVGTSRKRTSEAEKIAKYINEWINAEEGIGLSFGVISFYKAQIFAVYEALKQYGITERAQDGTWQLTQDYRFFESGKERLRIGTVDAFQGMEFDVVFLSMVRSRDIKQLENWIKKENDYARIKRNTFGHLMSENRLCVSMSRQKRALVMVGDSGLVNTQIAIDAVPALKKFYDLCKEHGVIL